MHPDWQRFPRVLVRQSRGLSVVRVEVVVIKIPLPFRLGKIVGHDKWSQAPIWDHPVLEIGNSYSGLKIEVCEWLDQNCQGNWKFGYNNQTYELRFDLEVDATMFLLRWS